MDYAKSSSVPTLKPGTTREPTVPAENLRRGSDGSRERKTVVDRVDLQVDAEHG
jgi:hypothetical protein